VVGSNGAARAASGYASGDGKDQGRCWLGDGAYGEEGGVVDGVDGAVGADFREGVGLAQAIGDADGFGDGVGCQVAAVEVVVFAGDEDGIGGGVYGGGVWPDCGRGAGN
jgi:hypothetical protein